MNNLKMYRENAGLSQEKLAALAGCTKLTILNAESGKRDLYTSTAIKIAKALGKTVEEIFEKN